MVYSDFRAWIKSGDVEIAAFDDNSKRIYFYLKQDSPIQTTWLAKDLAARQARAARRPLARAKASLLGFPQRVSVSTLRSSSTATAPSTSTGVAPAAAPTTPPSRPTTTTGITRTRFYTLRLPEGDRDLVEALVGAGVRFGSMTSSWGMAMLSKVFLTLFALWIPLIPLLIIFQRQFKGSGGSGGPGKRKGQGQKGGATGGPPVTFADVAGVGAAKEELFEAVATLRNASRYTRLNAKMPSGVLLAGPPGTGKTLLAKAVAGESGVPFFSASASEFVEMYVGRGAARIRELFAEARKAAPCVIFIDELDAVGARRGIGFNEERDQTLNQLLTEMDGFEGRPGVLVLAATNRPDTLDPALTRPGRLTRKITVPLPDKEGRRGILLVHLKKVPVIGPTREEAAELLSGVTSGMSGAELANVVNEAALMAGRRGSEHVELTDLVQGVDRTRFGVGGKGGTKMPEWASGLIQRLAANPAAPGSARNAM